MFFFLYAIDPDREIGQRALAEGHFARHILGRAAAVFSVVFVEDDFLGQWREQAEIDIHRLERGRAGIDAFDMAAGYMRQQRAMRSCRRWCK